MAVLHPPITNEGIYFITFTCHRWLPLIEQADGYDSGYNFFHVLRGKGHDVCGYVIMPNHLHFLLHYNGGPPTLNSLIGTGKRFMAYDLVARLKQKGGSALLTQLQAGVQPKDRQRGKLHEVWIDSFDVKHCVTEKFILQKLGYIHENPVRGKWKLAPGSVDYLHSSALFYLNRTQRLFAVRDYADFVKWETMYDDFDDWNDVR